ASLIEITYVQDDHDVELREDHPASREPESGSGDVRTGNVDTTLAEAAVSIDERYSTPMEHNNPMEPHTTVALWDGDELTLWTSTQGVHP
ncbi:molybdopterin-dependent oxidoreductase, partial [Klebsiella pneumoniae]|nr:molybdopterin-dependent oxidoreductase [Klebsiella pneumoniae]